MDRDEVVEANRDLTAEVERLTKLGERMEPVREAISALDLPAMDSYADAVRYPSASGTKRSRPACLPSL